MAGRLQHNEGPSLQPMRSPEESLKELNQPAKYPPFLALQLVFRDYLQGAPPDLFNKCRLVSKQFKSAVEAAHPPYTWHINGERLNRDLQTVIHFITSEPRWKWVTKVRLSEADVSMTQGDFKLLVAALGARAWESLALVEVNLTDPLMLPAIIKTSAERGTLRHLSIADSPISSAGLRSGLSALRHCLWTLQMSPGTMFVEIPLVAATGPDLSVGELFSGDSIETPKVAGDCSCQSVRPPVLGDAHKPRELGNRNPPAVPARLSMFPLDGLRTLWLVGLGGLTDDDVIGTFRRTPNLEEFRLFKSGLRVSFDDFGGIRVANGTGSIAPLTPAAVAGVFKGLTRHHCPRLARLSIGWKHHPIEHQDLHGSWLRRFADAHPGMIEVKLFVTGSFPSEDWLYALAKWAPTLEKVTGHFGHHSGDSLHPEQELVLLAKAPRLTELECLGGCYRDDIQWIRYKVPGTFAKLKHLGDDVGWLFPWQRNKYKNLVEEIKYGRRRREQPGGWEPHRTVVEPDVLNVLGLAAIDLVTTNGLRSKAYS